MRVIALLFLFSHSNRGCASAIALEQRGLVVGRERSVAKSAFLFVSNAGLLSSFVKAKFGISMPYDR